MAIDSIFYAIFMFLSFTVLSNPRVLKWYVISWLYFVEMVIEFYPQPTFLSVDEAAYLTSIFPEYLSMMPIWLRYDMNCNLFLVNEISLISPMLLKCQSLTPAYEGLRVKVAIIINPKIKILFICWNNWYYNDKDS